ncbi:MAG: glycosyltransferase family 2 protein, partial [Chthoniobacterales bacterium]
MNNRQRASIVLEINSFAVKPLISVVMPVCDPRPEWLAAAIDSVRRQLYTHWELCIADDASVSTEIHRILSEFALADSRIKVHFRKERGHIAASSNTALHSAAGEWVALLDHDDLLPEDALFCVASAISKNPRVKLIYSDEDKIDELGKTRSDPYFKPDWDYDLFCHQNLISHLGVYRRDILLEINGFRFGFDGSQDYDMALRFIERITEKEIHHIPRVLYHWRMHPESTSLNMDSKSYARPAAHRAVSEHFQRMNNPALLEAEGGDV